MPTREQLTHERVEALITILEAEGILENKESELLRKSKEFKEAPELAKGLVNRSGRKKNND